MIVLVAQEEQRILQIENNLEALATENSGLTEQLKLDINVTDVSLPNFLVAISRVHKINMTIDPNLEDITIVNNFSNVIISDLLIFLCKTYSLDIAFTGNILAIQNYTPPKLLPIKKEPIINYEAINNLITLDLDQVPLESTFRKLTDLTGKNLLYNNGMENIPLNLYLRAIPLEIALKKLAETNNMSFSKSKEGFYIFDRLIVPADTLKNGNTNTGLRSKFGNANENFSYEILDAERKMLRVDFENVPIAAIIDEISRDLNLNNYTATPLTEAGTVSFKAEEIYYDNLLERIFESQIQNAGITPTTSTQSSNTSQNRGSNSRQNATIDLTTTSTHFTYKKEDNIYFFGTADQLSVRKIEVIQLMQRSIELLGNPTPYSRSARAAGRTLGGNINFAGNNSFQNGIQNNQSFGNNQQLNTPRRINNQSNNFGSYDNDAEALVNILPDDIKTDLDIKVDFELNSFLVSGPATNINRFKKFIKEIDKPVPVVLIEVMILEVRKSATVETGISWGIGDAPVRTQGSVFPETNITLGANTVNRVIGGFDGFGSFNIGKVVPEFFATIKALEQNGNVKIKSTPKLSTLNGHRASLSIGETTYYVVTNQSFFGVQTPTTSEVRNFQPVDAELAISIKPLVSGNGQVTLDINVIQSDFSGDRIEDEAPPDLTSREFSSIIRMQNQDLAILGGLEEKVKNDSGSGVPFLARIPIIKWFFSKRVREDSKQKLTILIKPTVIY